MSSETQRRIIDAILAARDNIALIRDWSAGLDLDALRTDRKSRYAIEPAFMALDAAIRDIPTDLLGVHGVPANLSPDFATSWPTPTTTYSMSASS
jgi:hypothetical protein